MDNNSVRSMYEPMKGNEPNISRNLMRLRFLLLANDCLWEKMLAWINHWQDEARLESASNQVVGGESMLSNFPPRHHDKQAEEELGKSVLGFRSPLCELGLNHPEADRTDGSTPNPENFHYHSSPFPRASTSLFAIRHPTHQFTITNHGFPLTPESSSYHVK